MSHTTKGSCVCGNFTYEYEGDGSVINCFCLPCRKTSGTPVSCNLIMSEDKFKPSGKLVTSNRKGESGKPVTYHFCANCYNLIFVKAEAMAGQLILKAGTVDTPGVLEKSKPEAEIYTRNRIPWTTPVAGAAQVEGAPPS